MLELFFYKRLSDVFISFSTINYSINYFYYYLVSISSFYNYWTILLSYYINLSLLQSGLYNL